MVYYIEIMIYLVPTPKFISSITLLTPGQMFGNNLWNKQNGVLILKKCRSVRADPNEASFTLESP